MTRSLIRTTGAEGLELSSTDIKISSGDLIFSTADKGINLGVTSNTAGNTLDDYEEGTFDATITYDTDLTDTSPDETLTHSGNYYTKIGRFVFYGIKYFSKPTTFSGNAVNVSTVGIPFTALNVSTVRPSLQSFTPYYITGTYSSTHKRLIYTQVYYIKKMLRQQHYKCTKLMEETIMFLLEMVIMYQDSIIQVHI